MSTILECTDLDHSYGKKQALKNISLTIESGKIVGLFGPNGSGKTTLIKMIAGMIHDENKCIRICGEPVGEKTKAVISYSPDRMVLGQDRKVSGLLDMYELMYEDFDRGTAEENLKKLNSCRLANGKQPTVVELPMPDTVVYEEQRLPASYANFYIANGKVIFPTYKCLNDTRAAYVLEECFPDREVIGIDSTDIVWGLGSFHCLSQQMPKENNKKIK